MHQVCSVFHCLVQSRDDITGQLPLFHILSAPTFKNRQTPEFNPVRTIGINENHKTIKQVSLPTRSFS